MISVYIFSIGYFFWVEELELDKLFVITPYLVVSGGTYVG